MDNKRIVKLSNKIGIVSIILLIFWVFIFTIITVFDFKIFRENLTASFYLSVVGILALMSGALILNIMFNLTNISEHFENGNGSSPSSHSKRNTVLIILSFPVIFALLFLGDWLSSHNKEVYLINSAKQIITENPEKIKVLSEYRFDSSYFKQVSDILSILQSVDVNFPKITVIYRDTIGKDIVYIQVEQNNDNITFKKLKFIYSCSKDEREYLNLVFNKGNMNQKFDATHGQYELYYPVKKENRAFILYFTKYSRYGSSGS